MVLNLTHLSSVDKCLREARSQLSMQCFWMSCSTVHVTCSTSDFASLDRGQTLAMSSSTQRSVNFANSVNNWLTKVSVSQEPIPSFTFGRLASVTFLLRSLLLEAFKHSLPLFHSLNEPHD